MSSGKELIGGRIPGERIATTVATSGGPDITTTETEVMSVTAPLVSGRTYQIRVSYPCRFSVATDTFDAKIREDSVSGTQIQRRTPVISVAGGSSNTPVELETEYTATASGDKTFSTTLHRLSGSGTGTPVTTPFAPGFMYVDYIRDADQDPFV